MLGKGKISVNKISANSSAGAGEKSQDGGYTVSVNGKKYAVKIDGDKALVNGKTYDINVKAGLETTSNANASAGEGTPIKTGLPGNVLRLPVSVGDSVAEGDVIAVIEAMKMETEIKSTVSGIVKSVEVGTGDKVQAGDVLATVG